jgi:hypothetical protein
VSWRYFTKSRAEGDKGTHHAGEKNSFHKQLRAGHASHTRINENIDGMPTVTLAITCNDYNRYEPHAVGGNVYVILYTNASAFPTTVPLDSRVPSDSGKSVFSIHDNKVKATVAVAAVGLPTSATSSPVNFERSVREYLRQWKTSTALVYDSAFTSNGSKFMFDVAAFHYESKYKNDVVHILKNVLAKEFNISFRITSVKDAPTGLFGISKISWTRLPAATA